MTTAPYWDPDRADGAHLVLDQCDPTIRPCAAALLDLPPNLELARDSTGAINPPLVLAQLLDRSMSVPEVTRLLIDAGAIRPGMSAR